MLTESGNLFRRKTKTVVFLVNFIIQLATFAVNYVGEPFNVSIWKKRSLIWGLIACAGLSCVLIAGKREREREREKVFFFGADECICLVVLSRCF